MNQILLTDNYNNRDKKSNNNKNYNRNNSKDIKKIIIFFAVVILVFGAAIGILYGYNLYKDRKGQNKEVAKPEVSLEKSGNEVTIIAKAEAGINKIIYQWNEEDENVKEYGGRTKQEESISVPDGDNTLKVKVIDQAGQEIETTEEFSENNSLQDPEDKININLSIIESGNDKGKLKIQVKSEAPIKYMSYKWNNEEETKIEASESEEKTNLEANIDVKRGKNTLSVLAEDIEGNSNQVEKKFEGKLKPEFEVYREGNRLYMKITHDKGFKKIEFNINGIELTYDETKPDYSEDKKEVEYYFNLQEGENLVVINALSNEETSDIYEGRCTL